MHFSNIEEILAKNEYNKKWDHRILVVDDNPSFLRFMEVALTGPRTKVIAHNNPYQAIETFSQFHPDFVFLDINMPGLSGLTLLKMLNHINLFQAKIILLSANSNYARLIKDSHDICVSNFLKKPIPLKTLKNILENNSVSTDLIAS